MVGKIISLLFALGALAGAVVYAQKKGREQPRRDPVFETSKSGVPTPIDATDAEKEKIRKENAAAQEPAQVGGPAQENGGGQAKPARKRRRRQKPAMPSTKSYMPD